MILVALIIVSALLLLSALGASYRAGYREGFNAGVLTMSVDEKPPSHAELQAAVAREGRQ